MRLRAFLVLGIVVAGCHAAQPDDLEQFTAVLTGTVRRGPITPVCQVDVPCDEPFPATFDVRRGDRVVATFTSGTDGAFTVRLPAGELVVVPHADAPLMNPTSQVRPVTVQAGGLTVVDLLFDTGIR